MINLSSSSSSKPYRLGVGAMILNDAGEVFVGQRIDRNEAAWQMPQGGIDEGETPEKALERELKEEIGTTKVQILSKSSDWLYYELPLHVQSKMWEGRFRGQKQIWFALRFLGEDQDININTDQPEFKAWKWVPYQNLLEIAVPFKKDIYMAVIQEFQHLL